MKADEIKQVTSAAFGSGVLAVVPVVDDEAEWRATLDDGRSVEFWVDDCHVLAENRVHVVRRKEN